MVLVFDSLVFIIVAEALGLRKDIRGATSLGIKILLLRGIIWLLSDLLNTFEKFNRLLALLS